MLLQALVLFALHQGVCPSSFSLKQTTISALSNSKTLSLCVSNSVLVHGKDGKLTLVAGSDSTAPRCLIYPNGLSPDLTLSLLESGHTGCWSLYPPSQPVVIVNLGKPNSTQVRSALKTFKPQTLLIYANPRTGLVIGSRVSFSNSSHVENIHSVLLNLPVVIRFTPHSYLWNINGSKLLINKPTYLIRTSSAIQSQLAVKFQVEYKFPGLTGWNTVTPNILVNAVPLTLQVGQATNKHRSPRLVLRPCSSGSWGCALSDNSQPDFINL